MRIVIDIDERYYEIIKNDVERGMDYRPFVIIANGTPLPKGHGDLIDRRSFRENIDMCYPFTKYWQDHNPVLNMAKSELLLCLESESTIIEADGGGEDGEDSAFD